MVSFFDALTGFSVKGIGHAAGNALTASFMLSTTSLLLIAAAPSSLFSRRSVALALARLRFFWLNTKLSMCSAESWVPPLIHVCRFWRVTLSLSGNSLLMFLAACVKLPLVPLTYAWICSSVHSLLIPIVYSSIITGTSSKRAICGLKLTGVLGSPCFPSRLSLFFGSPM